MNDNRHRRRRHRHRHGPFGGQPGPGNGRGGPPGDGGLTATGALLARTAAEAAAAKGGVDVLAVDLFAVELYDADLLVAGQGKRRAPALTEPAPVLDANAERMGRRRRRRRKRGPVVSLPSDTTDLTIARGGAEVEDAETILARAAEVLREKFGFPELTRAQKHVIPPLLSGRDVVAVLPTGSGKSLCYQLPGMMVDGITVVVSPLIALMTDQESKLKARNLPVVRLDSTLKAAERRAAIARIKSGEKPLIVLTTPETLGSVEIREVLRAAHVALVAIDEAHCVSEWGHDFRPAYLTLGDRITELGRPQVLALTATAVLRVRNDIRNFLGLKEPDFITASPDRPNLRFVVLRPGAYGSKVRELVRLARELPTPGIVYCSTIAGVEEVWMALRIAQVPVGRYHGKMSTAERQQEQERFMARGARVVMAATNAFGLGIDKPDIRFVIHYQTPGSIEQYVQEAGRAGRDGKPSHCVLLFDESDLGVQEHFIKEKYPPKSSLAHLVEALAAWAGENRPVSAADLALAAHTRATYALSLLGELRDLGLVTEVGAHLWQPAAAATSVADTARAAAARYETLRIADTRRLQQVVDYAQAESCRSVLLRGYFGDPDPPKCGRCDVCTGDFENLAPAPPLKMPKKLAQKRERQRQQERQKSRRGKHGRRKGWEHRRHKR